jgi:hypothetical protein
LLKNKRLYRGRKNNIEKVPEEYCALDTLAAAKILKKLYAACVRCDVENSIGRVIIRALN